MATPDGKKPKEEEEEEDRVQEKAIATDVPYDGSLGFG